MKKVVILISILLIILSIVALIFSAINNNIGLIVYDSFLIIWNIGNLILAIKL